MKDPEGTEAPIAASRRRRCPRTLRAAPLLAAALLAFAAPPSRAADDAVDVERGAALYENHCGGCHDREIHRRDSGRIDSSATLRAWVHAWSVHQGLRWSEEEIDDVSAWLTATFYRFDE